MMIYVIRHGETASNVERIVQTPDTPLNARGRAQAQLLAERLARRGVAHILSSDLTRARMTAEALAAGGVAFELEPLLQERNFGALRGQSYAAIGRDIFAAGYEPPGGESWEAFDRRVDDAWQRVVAAAAATDGVVAVITHGLVCHSLASRHWRLTPDTSPPPRWGNTSLSIVARASPHRVELLNCTEHLAGSAVTDAAPAGV